MNKGTSKAIWGFLIGLIVCILFNVLFFHDSLPLWILKEANLRQIVREEIAQSDLHQSIDEEKSDLRRIEDDLRQIRYARSRN